MAAMTTKTSQFEVHRYGVTISVSRGGRGQPLVLCPGLLTTQADLHELIDLLRRDHDVVAFDLRGHGLSSPADRYSFEAFLGDLDAVVTALGHCSPLLVGHSLGADLRPTCRTSARWRKNYATSSSRPGTLRVRCS